MRASIITPTFNAITFIEECVANAASQGDVVLEHIVADGGSTDGTCEKVAELARTNPRLRLIPGPDRGQSDAMNKATATAAGEVIGILNVDDFYQPGAVARGVGELAKFPSPGLVVGDCRIIDEHGETVHWNRPKDVRLEALLQDSYLFPIPSNPTAYFYHRAVHDGVGGYDVDDHYAMDTDFLLRCVAKFPAKYFPEHWGNFRLIPGCKTHEDGDGPARTTEIIGRHRQHLSAEQVATMRRMWRVRKAKARIGNLLRRAGLRA